MGSDKKLEMIEKATRKPTEDGETVDDRDSHLAAALDGAKQRQLPAELLPELDDDDDDEDDESVNVEKSPSPSSSETRDGKRKSSNEVGEEIIKELNNIKRQNTITHYLLTASILVTLVWQLSEFSLIFKIKQGFSNPLKSIGGAIKGLFIGRQEKSDQDSSQALALPPTYLPGLKIPELLHLDLPGFETTSNDDDD